MKSLIHHIGLQVNEEDIKNFYVDVLKFNIVREFFINKDLSNSIFNIKKEVKVIYLKLDNIEFELFIDNNKKYKSFNHICLHYKNIEEITKRAKERNYKVFIKINSNKNNTIFINDSNNNIFEIKKLED